MRGLLLSFLLVAIPVRSYADCVWVPVCLAYQTPGIDALLIFLDGVKVGEKRPMWAAEGGRTNIWVCGRSTSLLTLASERAGEVSPQLVTASFATINPATCENFGPNLGSPSLGSYYGPKEQLIRAVRSAQSGGRPIDTDQDGTIGPNDLRLLELRANGLLADYTDFTCAEDVCP